MESTEPRTPGNQLRPEAMGLDSALETQEQKNDLTEAQRSRRNAELEEAFKQGSRRASIQSAKARRTVRSNIRARLGSPVKPMIGRAAIDEAGYLSSDLDDDLTRPVGPTTTTQEEAAERRRLSKRSDKIKDARAEKKKANITATLTGEDALEDALFMHQAAKLKSGDDYRQPAEALGEQPCEVFGEPEGVGPISEAQFANMVRLFMTNHYEGAYLSTVLRAGLDLPFQGEDESVNAYKVRGSTIREALEALYKWAKAGVREITQNHNRMVQAWVKGLLPQNKGSSGNEDELEEKINQVIAAGNKIDFTKMAAKAKAKEQTRKNNSGGATTAPGKRAAPMNMQHPVIGNTESSSKKAKHEVLSLLVSQMQDIANKQATAAPMNAQLPANWGPYGVPPPPPPPPWFNASFGGPHQPPQPPPPDLAPTQVSPRKELTCFACMNRGDPSDHLFSRCPKGRAEGAPRQPGRRFNSNTCDYCEGRQKPSDHQFSQCPSYLGCGFCGKQGHYARGCTEKCSVCEKQAPRQQHLSSCTNIREIRDRINRGKDKMREESRAER